MDNKLLEEVIENNLTTLNNKLCISEEEEKAVHKRAMEACDRLVELRKLDLAEKQYKDKLKFDRVIRVVEVAGIPVALFVADCLFKNYYMKAVCNFEKDYTFTTTPGRALSGLFKFKK